MSHEKTPAETATDTAMENNSEVETDSEMETATQEKADEVHAELKQMAIDAKRHRENPRLVRLLEIMAMLTGHGEEEETGEEESEPLPAPPAAPHVHAHNVQGLCACGDCLHQRVVGGVCIACDEEVEAA